MAEKNLAPELRFLEFEGEWKEIKLGKIANYYDGTHQTPNYLESGIPFFSVEHVTANQFSKTKYISIDVFNKENKRVKLEKGDILMTRIGSIGVAKYIDWDVQASFYVSLALIKQSENFDSRYLSNFIPTKKFQKELWKRTIHVAFPKKINLGEIGECKISLPSFPEQKKIASFLTSVDQRIQLLQKKKDKLEEYKKGVMQKLFSQEIRFKDENGSDFPDWEERRLGEVTKYYDGTHQTPKYVEKGIPFYSVEHVTANQFLKTKFISQQVFEKENERVKLEKGDILMTRIGSIGTAKHIDWDVSASFYVSLALIKQNETFNSKFLSYCISHTTFQKELWKRTIHVAFPKKINLGEIGECLVQLPSLPEQKKIASLLSSLDHKIEQVGLQIEKMQAWKKGLLQKMFV